jgi:hypothetical protein
MDGRAHVSRRPPVFLHCGWRTRGTWIWNRFRRMPGITAYYEPLSDMLASLRPDGFASLHAGDWASGHNFLDRPYFVEFEPLLARERAGVRGYRSSFATADFFAPPDANLPDLERYLQLLLRTAATRSRQPVLKFCRSLGRIGWMQQKFPDAVNIAELRNPLGQFASSYRQFALHNNLYFLAMPLLLLAAHRDLPPVRDCMQLLAIKLPGPSMADCETRVLSGSLADCYRCFMAFWILTAARIPDSVDLVIDTDLLAHSSWYRRECQLRLAKLTGQTFEFGPRHDDASSAASEYRPHSAEILATHHAAEAFLADYAGTEWCGNAAPALLGKLLAEASMRALTVAACNVQPAQLGELHLAARRATQAERELTAVLTSRSWKMTAPLRWLGGWLALQQRPLAAAVPPCVETP